MTAIDITLKNIILESSLYRMLDKIYDIMNPRSILEKSKEDLVEEAVKTVFKDKFNIDDRIKITLENIEILLNRNNVLKEDEIGIINNSQKRIESFYSNFKDAEGDIDLCVKNLIGEISKHNELCSTIMDTFHECKNNIIRIIGIYENLLYEELEIAKITLRLWNNCLTNIDDYKQGEPFKFLVYASDLSSEEIIDNLFSKNIIYTSLISNACTHTFRNREYGLIYLPNAENLLYISKGDCYSYDLEIEDFILENDYILKNNKIYEIKHMEQKACKTFLIEQIEEKSDLQNEKYNEITLINNKYSRPIAVFRFENCSEHYNSEAENLAQKLNLRLITITK